MQRLLLAAACVLGCLPPAQAQTADRQKAAVSYLQKLQTAEGGFLAARPADPAKTDLKASLRATSAAVRALKYFGSEPKDKDACAKFVAACFDPTTGGFADRPGGSPNVLLTAVGVMAVVELKMPRDKYAEPAEKYLLKNAQSFEEVRIAAAGLEALGRRPKECDAWLEQLAKLRNKDGTYGKDDGIARDTGSAVVVALRLGAKVENEDVVLKALKAGQRRDGAFGKAGEQVSDLETTYRVMRAFVMLKAQPQDRKALIDFIGRCHNTSDGGYGDAPQKPSTVGNTYYAAILLHWLNNQ